MPESSWSLKHIEILWTMYELLDSLPSGCVPDLYLVETTVLGEKGKFVFIRQWIIL